VRTGADERDPFVSADGAALYYASDATGIFNIHRMDLASGRSAAVSDVAGGAFWPCADGRGRLAFGRFDAEGYRIAVLDSVSDVPDPGAPYVSPLRRLRPKPEATPAVRALTDTAAQSKPYSPAFSKMMFLPRLMVDFPDRPKAGAYFYGSDVLDKVSVLGGAAVNGLLDTDLFLTFEVRRWRPTLSVEAFRVSRHTSRKDVDYRNTFLGVDLGADWALGDRTALKTVFRTDRYDAAMSFLTATTKVKIPYTYHKGNGLLLQWRHRAVPPSLNAPAPTRGRIVRLEADGFSNRFMTGFAVHSDYGTLVEVYRRYDYFQASLDWTEYIPAPLRDHSLALRLQAGWIDRPVDSFYDFYAGGLEGMRGYSYFGMGGRKILRLGLAYRFPIARRLGWRIGPWHLDRAYGVVYGDAGDAWSGGGPDPGRFKRDAGFQLRVSGFSFYGLPLSAFCDAAYGFDRLRDESGEWQGREWRTYFGILFDFID
jgi:hypothetical protein